MVKKIDTGSWTTNKKMTLAERANKLKVDIMEVVNQKEMILWGVRVKSISQKITVQYRKTVRKYYPVCRGCDIYIN